MHIRNLWLYNNIYSPKTLSTFYMYDETVASKGADEVISFMWHYFKHKLPDMVQELDIWCDSCYGQMA